MSIMSDPTTLDGVVRPATRNDLEGLTLTHRAEQSGATEALLVEPEAEDMAQLRARVARLEAQAVSRSADQAVPTVVSGRYSSAGGGTQLELRVDVDGPRPLMRISGDFFQTSGATTNYVGSFVVASLTAAVTEGLVKLTGRGRFSFPVLSPHVEVTIAPGTAAAPTPGEATVQFFNGGGSPSATYLCAFVSPHFRSVRIEQDSVTGTVPFFSYDTGSLPQPPSSPARVLTVPAAYAEAGIEVQIAGAPDVIPTGAAGTDARWNDAELHNAMVNHFSLWRNAPRWQVWQMVATSYIEDGVRGIMFDAGGAFQRQGFAVFHDAIKGEDPASRRAQLRTYVHELGHAFNLLHSWEKNLAEPPQPLGPNGGLGDLSWMNYVQNFQPPPPAPGGPAAYWAAFPFQFTDNELVHLRHGFYRDVIMGGNPFGVGAAEVDVDLFDDPVVDNSGLALDLRSKGTFRFGEPVVVEIKLATTDLRGRSTHGRLHPNDGFVTVAIRTPSGETRTYRPPLIRCADHEHQTVLDADRPAIYESAYVGYGKDGFYFQQPGQYQLRAQYHASDGSRVLSHVLRLTVRRPRTEADEDVAELMMSGDEQGTLLYLLGSRAESLESGNRAFDQVLSQYPDHPLAVYPRMVKGFGVSRDFKDLTPDKELRIRRVNTEEGIGQLSKVVESSAGDEGVDNITLGQVMRRLARVEAKAGNAQRATEVMDEMVEIFDHKNLKPHVMRDIQSEAARTKEEITRR
ncbi:hypothetical protein ABT116_17755 [Streptomyces sp. NPDC002130]|uniref:hypothetical protein n=1 Tax=Streptomyces sp. NPDC002130 TaxID=3155568 RepID=UPI00331F6C7C